MRILILEDEPSVREMIKSVFGKEDFLLFVGEYDNDYDLSHYDYILVDRDNSTRKWLENGVHGYEIDYHTMFMKMFQYTLEKNKDYDADNVLFISGLYMNNIILRNMIVNKLIDESKINSREEVKEFEEKSEKRIFSKSVKGWNDNLKNYVNK